MKEFDGKNVTIMSCSDCNTKCKHCYVSYKGNLSGDDLYEMCSLLKDRYQLNINGTEVLLHKDYFATYNLIGQMRLLSNGIMINQDDSIIECIKDSSIEMVAMSYHFEIQDEISKVSQVLLKDNIKKLQDNNIKVELMCTVTKDNYDKILDICEKVIALGVKKMRFINYLRTGNALDLSDANILTDKQIEIFFEQLNKARSKYPIDTLLIKRCGSFGFDMNHSCNFKCSACKDKVIIAPDLNVYPCIYMVKLEFKIGYYKDGKVYIEEEIVHNQDECLAKNYYNKNKLLVRKCV